MSAWLIARVKKELPSRLPGDPTVPFPDCYLQNSVVEQIDFAYHAVINYIVGRELLRLHVDLEIVDRAFLVAFGVIILFSLF